MWLLTSETRKINEDIDAGQRSSHSRKHFATRFPLQFVQVMHLICLLTTAMAKHVQRLWTRARALAALAVGDFASVATRLYLQLSSALIIYFDVLFYE